jgi:hypothetical protein
MKVEKRGKGGKEKGERGVGREKRVGERKNKSRGRTNLL